MLLFDGHGSQVVPQVIEFCLKRRLFSYASLVILPISSNLWM
jgi:hypothetical protein